MTKQKTNLDNITRRTFTKEVYKLQDKYSGKASEDDMNAITAILDAVDAAFIGTWRYGEPKGGYDPIANSIYAAAVKAGANGNSSLQKDLASIENSDSLINKFSKFVESDKSIVNYRKVHSDKLQYLRELERTSGSLVSMLSSEKGRMELSKQLKRIEKEPATQ